MAEVTEAAIKSAKFYKHVVQSVEKFIQKVSEYFSHVFAADVLRYSDYCYNTAVNLKRVKST